MSAKRIMTTGVAVAALALVWGCKKPEAPAHKGAPPPVVAADGTPAATASPMSYSATSPAAEVELKLPPALAHEPDLHARLYAEAVRDLKAFAEGAANERAESEGEEGDTAPTQPYSKSIDWSVAADTSKLMSLSSISSEYSGGAHGNAAYASILWDKALKRLIAPTALFGPGADAAMDKALCDALIAEKKSRLGDNYTPPGPEWSCPRWRDTPFVLTASTTPGKAGGLTFLLAPYLVGAYAEGTYEVTVPLSAFARYLKPAYADEFAGAPRPVTRASQ